jgi:hypothetical protein
MKSITKKIKLIGLIKVIFLTSIVTNYSQSIQFQHAQNGILTNKRVDLNKKDFIIVGSDTVCKGIASEYSVSTNEAALWSNGVFGVKTTLTITKDTIIKAIITNKYGCEYVQSIRVEAAELPLKPVIERFGDSLIVKNVTGQFEWYRNGQLFSVGLSFIRTDLGGTYTVKVKNTFGCENISDPYILSGNAEINTLIDNLLIFPNPANRYIFFESIEIVQCIQIYNFNGRMVKSFNNINMNSGMLNLEELNSDLYFLKFKTINGLFIEKLSLIKN